MLPLPLVQRRKISLQLLTTWKQLIRRYAEDGRDHSEFEVVDGADPCFHLGDPDPVGIPKAGEDQTRRQLILRQRPLHAEATDGGTCGIAKSSGHHVPFRELDDGAENGIIGSLWGTG